MKKILLLLNLFIFSIANIKPSDNIKTQYEEKKFENILEKLFTEYNLEFNDKNQQLFLELFFQKINNIPLEKNLESSDVYIDELETITDDITMYIKNQNLKSSKKSYFIELPLKISLYLGAIFFIISKLDFSKIYNNCTKFIEFIKKDTNKKKNHQSEKIYVYPVRPNFDNYFKNNTTHYKTLNDIRNFHIMMQRLYLNSDILNCKLENLKNKLSGQPTPKTNELQYLLSMKNLFEKNFGTSKINSLIDS